jgi:phosphopantothenoylcysteine synthetase/decarboxylase
MSQADKVFSSLLSKNVEPSTANTFLKGFSGAQAMRDKYAAEYNKKKAASGGSIQNTSVFTPAVMQQHEKNQQAIQTGTLAQQPNYPIPVSRPTQVTNPVTITTTHVATPTKKTQNTQNTGDDTGEGGDGGFFGGQDDDDEDDEEGIEDDEDENWFKREKFLNTPNWVWILALCVCLCSSFMMTILLLMAVL